MVIHLSPANDLSGSKAFTTEHSTHRGHREILKVSGLFSVISVLSSERSERVVKRIFGQVNNQIKQHGGKGATDHER
jgi:hypothetical protein